MALRGREIKNFDDISLTAVSRGLPICVSSSSFQKSRIGWPQQPQQNGYQILVKNWIFDDPCHKKEPLLVIFVPGMIQPSRLVKILMK
jgi:hypothetical protein